MEEVLLNLFLNLFHMEFFDFANLIYIFET